MLSDWIAFRLFHTKIGGSNSTILFSHHRCPRGLYYILSHSYGLPSVHREWRISQNAHLHLGSGDTRHCAMPYWLQSYKELK